MSSLKDKTISGMLWSAVERFGYTFIMFLSNLFLARLLSPDDFGLIGMIMVFVAIASIIVDSGFASALIQKKAINAEDYSTVFYVNIGIAIFLYIILYFLAPEIAQFYKQDVLIELLRTVGLVLIINAFSIVQIAKLKRELNFKLLSIVSVISSLIGCGIGVLCAYYSFEVWSLVIQILTISLIKSVILYLCSNWKPKLIFSKCSFKELYKYGSMILGSQVIDTVYLNVISLIVGKAFSSKTLGIYTQARALENIPNQTLTTIVNQVTFPVFSQLQDDPESLKKGIRKSLKSLTWINFPLMILLIIIAEPLFRILYTDKWIEAVPLFQIACFGGMMLCVNSINGNILMALGSGKLFFWSGFYKRLIGLGLVILGLCVWGLWGLMYLGVALVPYVFFVINVFYTRRIFNYGYREQLQDIYPAFVISIIAGGITFLLSSFCQNMYAQFIMSVCLYGVTYIFFSIVLKMEALEIYSNEIKCFIKKIQSL